MRSEYSVAAASTTDFNMQSGSRFLSVAISIWIRLRQEVKFRAYEYFVGLTRNPEWFLMRRLARTRIMRSTTHWLRQRQYRAQPRPLTQRSQPSCFANQQPGAVVAALETSGLYQGLQLPTATVQAIRTFAEKTPCYVNGKHYAGFFYHQKVQAQKEYQKPILTGQYFNVDQRCAAIADLIQDPLLLAIAADYLQTQPAYLGSQLWWSFPGEANQAQRCQISQAFHYDLDGYRFLKIFFYLTDVDVLSGPHVIVQGTHRTMKWAHRLLRKRYTDRAILAAYGTESVATLYGPAGYGFVEDTFCFHKGEIPLQRDRLLLQVEYGAKDYGMQRHQAPVDKLQLLPGQKLFTTVPAKAV